MTEDQARLLFLEHCQPGNRGALERHGERPAVAAILAALRPQPSGETRALLERIAAVRARKDFTPQQANAGLLTVLDDCAAALSTTPARAEAQDEGAAGEDSPITAAIRAKLDKVKATTYRAETPAERMKDGKLDGLNTALAIAMVEDDRARSHPSQPPAADEDRVRIGPDLVERLRGWPHHAQGADYSVASIQALMTEAADALKSTAAKEGGAL